MGDSIYAELLAAVNTVAFPPRNVGESVSDYLGRLVRTVHTVSDEAWAKLTEPCQAWFNEAAAKINAGGLLLECPGFTDEPVTVALDPKEKVPAAPKKTKEEKDAEAAQAKADKAASKAKEKADKEAAKKAAKPERARGVSEALRELIIRNQGWTTEQLKQQLILDGWVEEQLKVGTLSTLRTDTLSTIKIIKLLGHWTDTVAE